MGSVVKALPASNTWMNQYELVGLITEIFHKSNVPFAKISIPKWLLERNHGGHIIREWITKKWLKPRDTSLLLDEGIALEHLELSELPTLPAQTIEEQVSSLIDQAFGPKGYRLGISVIHYPAGLVISPGICTCKDCNQLRSHLAWHNNHGTVEAFMVCEVHYKEFNGVCSDGFPVKVQPLCEAT